MKTSVEIMLHEQLQLRGIKNPNVLAAMSTTPREIFVPPRFKSLAYDDRPLPIGHGQTISQPYIVAKMLELGRITSTSIVLDVGTGCGYMAAVASKIARKVYTLESIAELSETAKQHFAELEIQNIEARIGNGYMGWPDDIYFDAILVSCAPDHAPQKLLDQLKPGGTMVIPISRKLQPDMLTTYQKKENHDITTTERIPVQFVPMV